MSMPQSGTMQADMAIAGRITVARPALHERGDALNQRLEALDVAVAHLVDRLEPVLRPSFPTPQPEAPPRLQDRASDAESWLADYLTSTQARLESVIARIRYLDERIDL